MSFFRIKIKDEYPINFKFYSFTFKVAKVLIFKKEKREKNQANVYNSYNST